MRSFFSKKNFITEKSRIYYIFLYFFVQFYCMLKQVSNDAYETLMRRLPTLEQIENSVKVKKDFITDYQRVSKELEPLVKFIDFKRIKGHILVNIIEPLKIVPAEMTLIIY